MKQSRALVLNQDYTPISVLASKRAFAIWFKGHADIIHNYPVDEKVLKTVNKNYPAPSVIRINKYANIPYKRVPLTKNNVYKRDGFQCVYCGSKEKLTIDHVIPRSKGGRDSWKNLATACESCNSKKGDTVIEIPKGIKLFRPHHLMMLSKHMGIIVRDEWKKFLFMN